MPSPHTLCFTLVIVLISSEAATAADGKAAKENAEDVVIAVKASAEDEAAAVDLAEDEAEVAELVRAARKIRVGGTYLVTTTCPSFHDLTLTAKDGTEYSLTFESGDLSAGSNSRYQLNNDEEFWDLVDRYAEIAHEGYRKERMKEAEL